MDAVQLRNRVSSRSQEPIAYLSIGGYNDPFMVRKYWSADLYVRMRRLHKNGCLSLPRQNATGTAYETGILLIRS